MVIPGDGVFGLLSLRVFRVRVLFAMLVREFRGMVGQRYYFSCVLHWTTESGYTKKILASWTTAVLVALELGPLCGSSPAYLEVRNVEDLLK